VQIIFYTLSSRWSNIHSFFISCGELATGDSASAAAVGLLPPAMERHKYALAVSRGCCCRRRRGQGDRELAARHDVALRADVHGRTRWRRAGPDRFARSGGGTHLLVCGLCWAMGPRARAPNWRQVDSPHAHRHSCLSPAAAGFMGSVR
jgi:hypothetical protein